MTELEKLRADLQKLRLELAQTRNETRSYLQNVAHQLTAPLGAIKWNIDALKNDKLPPHRRETLSRSISSQATILVRLVKNFSLMANLETDKELGQLGDESETDLLRLAINISSDFQMQGKEQNKRIEVDAVSFERLASGRNVLAEKVLVSQALSNVLENAVKYSNPGSTIAVSAVTDSGIGIAVTSLGIPIELSDKEKIFERGYRGQKARQSVAPGTGIGLYLARRIMTLHGGDITLGMQGNIVRFILTFPKSRFL